MATNGGWLDSTVPSDWPDVLGNPAYLLLIAFVPASGVVYFALLLRGSIRRGARAVHARCGYLGCSVDPFIQSQSGGSVTPQSPPGTIYNSSPSRPSPREVVQIPDAVRTRCTRGARAVRILPLSPALWKAGNRVQGRCCCRRCCCLCLKQQQLVLDLFPSVCLSASISRPGVRPLILCPDVGILLLVPPFFFMVMF